MKLGNELYAAGRPSYGLATHVFKI